MCSCPSPPGRSMCHCAACHRYFTAPSAFTAHQTVGEPAGVVCHDPATRGLVPSGDVAGVVLWSWPRRGAGPETRRHEEAGAASLNPGSGCSTGRVLIRPPASANP